VSDRVAGYYLDAAITYCTSVLSGKITANKWVKAACRRQLDDLEAAERDPTFPFEWRPDKAEHICRFLEMLPHIKGKWAGRRIVLDLWQILIVTTVFGWYRKTAVAGVSVPCTSRLRERTPRALFPQEWPCTC
jgi:Phage terminase-like protein, large subunit